MIALNSPARTRRLGVPGLWAFTALLCVATTFAQDTTHPRDMGLPQAQFERPAPESMQVTLKNGLVAYIAEDHRAPLVTLTAYLGVGTGHGNPGDAAALAAALRRGPQSMTGSQFVDMLASMHADFRVSQGHELTEVFLDVPASERQSAMELLGELISMPAFAGSTTAAQPKKSAGSIDYNYSLGDAISLFNEHLFAGHPFGRVASADDQSRARDRGARELHQRYVVAKNMSVAIAGDFNRSKAVKETQRAFALFSAQEPPATTGFPALTSGTAPELITAQADRIQGWIVIGHELPEVPAQDEAALAVMDYILGAYHLDSRLYRASRELRGLTNDNSAFLEPGDHGPGTYSFRTYGRPEAVKLLVKLTFDELNSIRDTLVTDTELFVAKGALIDGIYAERYATGVDASRAYAREWLTRGNHNRSAAFTAEVRKVTAESVRQAALKYIHPERMTVVVLGPLEKIDAAKPIESEPPLSVWGR